MTVRMNCHLDRFGQLLVVLLCGFAAWSSHAATDHWSFQRLNLEEPPDVPDKAWVKTPVDRFILAKLLEHDLRPQPEADRHSLIRRVSAGLTGLPPSPEAIGAFVEDPRPDAYERLVDRLLDSPHFGERWARHWLDVARFGESDGILTVNEDKVRADAWHYRDAVIRAFNEDLSFDRFVRYQFAEAGPDAADFKPLRQFLQLGTRLQNNADPNDRQFHRLDDMVSATGNAFLAMTFGCARCHDHPVDPMSTEEYYQFTAVFFDQVKERPRASAKTVPLYITEPRVLERGSWSSPGKAVDPGFLRMLMGQGASHWRAEEKSELEALADWMTDLEHGAGIRLARVMVNRLWHFHFGQGLVKTPNDFGVLGSPPSHPELLDWLAAQLIANQWRLKPIHRLLVNSATYRQAAASDARFVARDADNIWLWHHRVQRLDAETIRDQMLSVAGVLKTNLYGPSISIGNFKSAAPDSPDSWRRSIYLQAHRSVRHPTLSLFDAPNTERSVGARTTSTTPDGALFALNAPLVWELAEHFAGRVQREAGPDRRAQIRHAYLLALSRPPQPAELDIGLGLLRERDERALVDYCHVILGLNEFIYTP